MKSDAKSTIETGKAILGIEFGSTRIKAVLIDQENKPIAQGNHTWENQLVDGLWTYSIEAIWHGSARLLCRSPLQRKKPIRHRNRSFGGYWRQRHDAWLYAVQSKEEILVPFRTWRNTKYRSGSRSFI